VPADFALSTETRASLHRWLHTWNTPHLAGRELHGPQIRPHGSQWKALMRAAGFEPKTRLPAPPGTPAPARRTRPRLVYLHRCPVCQRYRIARRLMRRWRCAACVDVGLDGELVITRYQP
jgi:predicted SprT family Zn-dependent metalloprotease